MGQTTRDILKSYFELGDKPTPAEFANFIDSVFNLIEDELPISKVTNLQQMLDVLNAIQTPSGLEKVIAGSGYAWRLVGENHNMITGYVHLKGLQVRGGIDIKETGGSIFIGENAGLKDDRDQNYNVFIGDSSGRENVTGIYNTIIGFKAAALMVALNYNTVIGATALYWLTSGFRNTAIGESAGQHYGGDAANPLTSSRQSVFIGDYTMPESNDQENQIVIGSDAVGNGSNSATLGNTNIEELFAGQNGQARINATKIKLKPSSLPSLSVSDAGTIVCDSADNNRVKNWDGTNWNNLH